MSDDKDQLPPPEDIIRYLTRLIEIMTQAGRKVTRLVIEFEAGAVPAELNLEGIDQSDLNAWRFELHPAEEGPLPPEAGSVRGDETVH